MLQAADFVVGDALVQPSLNRISVRGRVMQVEPKVMQVLTLMAARPGAVVPREDFLNAIWGGASPDDYLLNRAVSELRRIFGDEAQTPRYIETIRKAGYRLAAPIAPAKVVTQVVSAPERRAPSKAIARTLPRIAPLPGLGFAAVLLLAIWLAFTATPNSLEYEVRPLTSFSGRELDPALSPDGSRVAFVWDGGRGGTFDVFVKTLDSEAVLNLTDSAAVERYPAWSADGRVVFFVRLDDQGASIMQVSALGGGARRIDVAAGLSDIRGLAVSPDGARIAFAGRESDAHPYRINVASLATSQSEILTSPIAGSLGDVEPIFSRDGRSIIFIRSQNEVTKDLYSVTLAGGAATRITFDNRKISGLAWAPDSERLLFTSTRSGMYRLWSVAPGGGEPELAPLSHESAQRPATASGHRLIAFEEWIHRSQLRRIDLAHGGAIGVFLGSTRWDSAPSYAPDGERIAFVSNRSGPPGVWISDRDGRNAVQIADADGAFVDRPAWSPDGRTIAFDASPDGVSGIFAVAAEGGPVRRITDARSEAHNPSWSRDGAWIYFESSVSGASRIYAQPAGGGAPVEIADGVAPRESIDGAWLIYAKSDSPGLWRRPRSDWRDGAVGDEVILARDLELADGGNWAPGADGVYFIRRPERGPPSLSILDYAGRRTRDLVSLSPRYEGWGLALSPHETELFISELAMDESDLRLATPKAD